MSFDIYGNRLEPGHCEVHPDEPHEFPCPRCRGSDQPPQPEPCEACWYARGVNDYCDGTCQRLPMSEWHYFKLNPDELPTGSV